MYGYPPLYDGAAVHFCSVGIASVFVNMNHEADKISSGESWDDHIDNWTEFCKELNGELPKV